MAQVFSLFQSEAVRQVGACFFGRWSWSRVVCLLANAQEISEAPGVTVHLVRVNFIKAGHTGYTPLTVRLVNGHGTCGAPLFTEFIAIIALLQGNVSHTVLAISLGFRDHRVLVAPARHNLSALLSELHELAARLNLWRVCRQVTSWDRDPSLGFTERAQLPECWVREEHFGARGNECTAEAGSSANSLVGCSMADQTQLTIVQQLRCPSEELCVDVEAHTLVITDDVDTPLEALKRRGDNAGAIGVGHRVVDNHHHVPIVHLHRHASGNRVAILAVRALEDLQLEVPAALGGGSKAVDAIALEVEDVGRSPAVRDVDIAPPIAPGESWVIRILDALALAAAVSVRCRSRRSQEGRGGK